MSARYGLLGEKLGHSFSPQIHRELGGYEYALMEVAREDLSAFFGTRDFEAINVTIPYKQAVLPWMDSLSEAARKIGCVNTVVKDASGALHGFNTDYYGFTQMVHRSCIAVAGRKCLVLGSGGASRTVCTVLRDLGAAEIVVISRRGPDNYENIARHADARVIVNATPVGMFPHNGVAPVSLSAFPRLDGVLDLIYNPARTALLLQAEARGIPCLNGLYMLTAQAKQASELFRGKQIDDGEISRITALISAQTANIVLIGLPGCGKTTVGRLLAERSGRPFIDTDRLVKERAGCTCGDYLRTHGEEAFRQLEAEALREAGMRTGCVIAAGGMLTEPENRDILRQNGIIFHLDRPPEALSQSGGRPLSASPEMRMALRKTQAASYAAMRDYSVRNEDAETAAREIERLLEIHWEESR